MTDISNAKNLSDIIVAMTQTVLTPQTTSTIKPVERTEQRKKENSFLIHEIINSLMT